MLNAMLIMSSSIRVMMRQSRCARLLVPVLARRGMAGVGSAAGEMDMLRAIEQRAIFLSSYTIYNANVLREKRDGLKVGGHQASSSSSATILTALLCKEMQPEDRIAVKPHAGPLYHALLYLAGKQSLDQLQRFRSYGGIQSYPSRTKDKVEVDFSTGSVGLGASITTFASLMQDWLHCRGLPVGPGNADGRSRLGRMMAVVGDAEMDEGSVAESMLEAMKLHVRNNWWFLDFNRQSLDKTTDDRSFRQLYRSFRANDWEVITLRYGKKLQALFRAPNGGKSIKRWFLSTSNDDFAALCFHGGKAIRKHILDSAPEAGPLLETLSDDALYEAVTNLGGHCMETLFDAFEYAKTLGEKPVAFICFTVKGHATSLSGHRDNHGLFMNQTQMDRLTEAHGMRPGSGEEWERFAGNLGYGITPAEMQHYVETAPYMASMGARTCASDILPIPEVLPCRVNPGQRMSTQAGFGAILLEVANSEEAYADRIVTMSPDVSTTTNLSGFLNKRGVFARDAREDPAKRQKIMSVNKWEYSPQGQHIELGIAENNLFLAAAAAGLTAPLFGHRTLPVACVYDPFVFRGLDAMSYALYQQANSLIVGTPSGVSLAPEGGMHQSGPQPLLGISMPHLVYFEPAFVDELQVMMAFAFDYMQRPGAKGGSVYLRLTTREIEQPEREMTQALRTAVLAGAYFHPGHEPSERTNAVLVFTGVVAPEALDAVARVTADSEAEVALLQVTSPDLLYLGFNTDGRDSHVAELLRDIPRDVELVTAMDGHPLTLAWLGSVLGHRVRPLGVAEFGQSADIPDIFRHMRIDADAMVDTLTAALAAGEAQR